MANIIDGLKQWLTAIKDKREMKEIQHLMGVLERMNKLQVFNPYKAGIPSSLYNENKFTMDLSEAYVWFQGSEKGLSDYYTGRTGNSENTSEYSMFWYASPTDGSIRRVHAGLPRLISETMPTVLFGNGYDIKVSSFNENGENDVVREEQLQEIINTLSVQQGINIKTLLEQSAITESWAGDIAWKIAISTELSPYPILIKADPRNYEPVVIMGIEIGIIFKDYKEVESGTKKEKYVIREFYTKDSKDDTSLIQYSATLLKENGKEVSVALNSVPDEYVNGLLNQPSVEVSDDGLTATIRFNGLKGVLAFHKPNKVNASDTNALFGVSDHYGNYTNYDSLDEAVSVLIEEARTHKDIRNIPSSMIPKNENGRMGKFNEFIRNYLVVEISPDQNSKQEITYTHFADKTEQHLKKYETFLGLACANAKISPLTLGLTNVVGMQNSDKTLQERSRVTVETRKKKLELWEDFLERVLYKLIEVYDFMWSNYPEVRAKAVIESVKATEKDITINVTFPDYNEMGILDRAKEWGQVLSTNAISIEKYVDMVYRDDLTAEQKQREVSNIKIERNIALSNPDLISMQDLEEEQ